MAGDDAAGLAREVERDGRRIAELEKLVARLTNAVRPPAGESTEADQAARVRSWLLVDDDETARGDLDDLTEWLDAVYLRFPDTALPACWARHPHVVEELFQLRWMHDAAYRGKNASWQRVADFHERYRPGVVKRVEAALGSCELALHVPGAQAGRPSPEAPLRTSNDEVASHWAAERQARVPTAAELSEASQYEDEQNKTHR